jgi:hypothetical protein
MGRHRHELNDRVAAILGRQGDPIDWLDFGFDPKAVWPDAEISDIEFVEAQDDLVFTAWEKYWPQLGTPPSWDAVGTIGDRKNREYILVEAKAHIGEMTANCKAEGDSLQKIKDCFKKVKDDLGINDSMHNWLSKDYQYANRISVLWFLKEHAINARLVFIYFYGDWIRPGIKAPCDESGWQAALEDQKTRMGLNISHKLSDYIHTLFIPVSITML